MTDEKKPDRGNRDLALFRKPDLAKALGKGLGQEGTSKLARHLSRPLILEEAGPPRILAQLLIILSVTIGVGGVWAAITEITETAIAHGQIMPAGSLHHVEHLEGGIVAEVLVEEGEVVASGQTLMRLRSSEARAELERQRAREASLSLRAERLRAFVLDRDPDFSAGRNFSGLVADQQAILDLQREARESQRTVLLSRIDQRRVELDGLEERKQNLDAQIDITTEQVGMRRNLVKKGLDSRVNLLDSERKLTEIRGDLLGVMGEISRTREALHEAEGALAELDAKIRNDALNEMGDVTGELAEVRESLSRLEDRVARLEVKAPVAGVVNGLSTRTIGSVVAPGEVLLEIVPIEETLIAEVQILPHDIGHLSIGQAARVKVTSYDVAQFGALDGKLSHISASTFQDEAGEPFFKGVIELSQAYIGGGAERHPVLPGMVVDVDISTGRKTLLQYLLKPLYRAFDRSFTER
jgi:HlyD family secretion protein/adhesin transport system membrane fusion protein